ncbi:thiamine transporter membrane protein [Marinobacterium sp. xm-d-579]|nr:thiamine transporter membrane protein [Marinobacterium sp. xm-d-579]
MLLGRTFTPLMSAVAYLGTLSLTVLAFWGLIGFEETRFTPELLQDTYLQNILSFTLYQALLSALGSLLLAIPIARALHRLRPAGRDQFLRLSLLAFVMPSLILITGIVNLLGPQSPFTDLLKEWKLFGLNGILIAHIYLNFPLAVRILYQGYSSIPLSREQLADQLKLSFWQRLRHIEWPAIKSQVATLAGLIFILCFNSFAIVLTLGGGPKATTLELAIYQALKYDFNLNEALTLAWLQFAIAGLIYLALIYASRVNWLGSTREQPAYRLEQGVKVPIQLAFYLLGWAYLLGPLIALFMTLNQEDLINYPYAAMLKAMGVSLLIALSASLLALLTAIALLTPIRKAAQQVKPIQETLFSWLANQSLVAPAMVLSTGSYIWLISRGLLETYATLMLILLNAFVLLPFLLSQLRPRFIQFDSQYAKLVGNLKLTPMERVRIIYPFIRRSLLAAFSLGLLLALGDVSIFAIFGSYESPTLPWLIYTFAGTYRMSEAAITSVILLGLCYLLLILLERSVHHEQ